MGNLIFVNGKPRSGKDTVGKCILNRVRWGKVVKMTEPIDRAFQATFNLTDEEFATLREDLKDSAVEVLPGLLPFTLREWYISFSEHFMKPLAGNGCFGAMAAQGIWEAVRHGIVVVTDCGFNSEVEAIMAARPDDIELDQVYGVRVVREGQEHTEWDSREAIRFRDFGIGSCIVGNHGTEADLDVAVDEILGQILSPAAYREGRRKAAGLYQGQDLRQKHLWTIYQSRIDELSNDNL